MTMESTVRTVLLGVIMTTISVTATPANNLEWNNTVQGCIGFYQECPYPSTVN